MVLASAAFNEIHSCICSQLQASEEHFLILARLFSLPGSLAAWMDLLSSTPQVLSPSSQPGLSSWYSWVQREKASILGLAFELLLEATVTSACFLLTKAVIKSPGFRVEEDNYTSSWAELQSHYRRYGYRKGWDFRKNQTKGWGSFRYYLSLLVGEPKK